MRKKTFLSGFTALIAIMLLLSACSSQQATTEAATATTKTKVGIVLSDIGLGDQSYSDAAFRGLIKARNEESIIFDYKEISQTKTYDEAFNQLTKEDNDVIIGLGYIMKDSLEKAAKANPNKQFIIVDETSELPNVASITFKEEEGSFLAGAVAAMASTSNRIGFIGGVESPLLHKFQSGFEQGARSIDPNVSFVTNYTGDFGNPAVGSKAAKDMIENDNVDVIYTVAGLTGVGALQEAQTQGKYAIGVDSDQFFVAEKAVLTSMIKNVDVALYSALQSFAKNNHTFKDKDMVFGLTDDGVGLTDIHVIQLTAEQQKQLEDLKKKLISGEIKIDLTS
ncbi:BMP family ABC transporter substrate-binding protein [Paenibacillus sp. PsM32]|uniref:BMP family lipoprotein n=1 Tax=unclassified Paenibacillus TaxID=185978 RepID=UPI00263A8E7B|nr:MULTISPECIES: BMP family ABC transporter substrate-binding protein [unclassified Paenibacillus]MDN4618894.1 BMP family ABC transporter substrate-binding protein [Paenibacillus sp. PsM32]MDQ1235197.1 basic membrane protein A [Paenibacillus sp. SORGH_AS_0306]MDR6112244.1 basic membrane protein A [Paenibacillus sp. SORGH_AS_0338]